jgi:hypothetical protein
MEFFNLCCDCYSECCEGKEAGLIGREILRCAQEDMGGARMIRMCQEDMGVGG